MMRILITIIIVNIAKLILLWNTAYGCPYCPTLSEQRDRLILDLTLIQRDIKVTWESDFNEHDISISPRGSLSKNAVVRISKENVFKIHSIIFKWIMNLRCFE